MKVFRLLVPVADIESATEFYGSVFRQAGERVSEGRHYFNCDGVTVACFDPVADGDDYSASPFSEPIYFSVDDLDAVLERVGRGRGHVLSGEHPRRRGARQDRKPPVG